MYYLNKIAGWILSPVGILFIGFGFAWGLRLWSKRLGDKRARIVRVSDWTVVLTAAFLWIMSCGITTRFVGASLEQAWEIEGRPHGDISGLPTADAIVVLGGGMGVHRKCGASEMFGSADRVWQGAKLFKARKAGCVALSGPQVEISTAPLMEDLGVPRGSMMYFSDARNTEEESKLIYQRLVQMSGGNAPKILLVTSAWHMGRAKLLFERAGFNVVPAPTDFEMSYGSERPIMVSDFFPSADALSRNSYAIKEIVGGIGYRLFRR